MNKSSIAVLFLFVLMTSCKSDKEKDTDVRINREILASLGTAPKKEFSKGLTIFKEQIAQDSMNVDAYLGLAETNILLFAFGLESRDNTISEALLASEKAYVLDSLNTDVQKLSAKLHFLNKEWEKAEMAFLKSIEANPENLDARHWYSLLLMATKRIDEAFAQSEIIMSKDVNGDFLIARASLLYFQYRFEEMKPLMYKAIEKDSTIPWTYDWLGMAYNGLNEHNKSIETYIKAFELSDGTVEVGGGLGHALALGGETKLAKQMADYYHTASKDNYLPPVQRSFIHLGLAEYDEAIALLEQAYEEESWFLIFMQIEHWYDPIREDQRFKDIMDKMNFPRP
ncbi:tetratricopeptide repeat protein [Spongiimicrobium sp. 3-5]|uniref:tetratricopeptide repeat protein n=1 Tax=Spongiimicrobium sp. 3-5 TaxID=3332596 RepID=UPI003981056F